MLDRLKIINVRWWVRWLPVMILWMAAYWRFHHITVQSFWHDEGNTLRLVQRNLTDLINAVKPDIHPPGYYIMLKGWTALVGEHELGLRAYSAFWGLVAVACTYALGARLYARAAGIMAMLLVAMNAFPVYYSQEARMYAQLAGLSVASLWLLAVWVQAFQAKTSKQISIAFTLAAINTLGLYTQYTYPVTMLVQGIFFLWFWLQHRHQTSMGIYVAANLMTIILFLPWLPTAYDQITHWTTFDTGEGFTTKLQTIFTYVAYGNTARNLTFIDYVAPLFLLAALILPDWYRKPPSNSWRVLLPMVWLASLGGVLLFSGAYRETNLKFLLPAQIAFALLIGRSTYLLWDSGSGSAALPLEMLPRYISAFAFLIIASSAFSWLDDIYTDPQFFRDDYRAIAEYIESHAEADDAIILNAPNQQEVFTYYYGGNLPLYPLPRGLGGDDAATLRETQQIISDHARIFVILWSEGERDPNNIMKDTLDNDAYEVFSRWYGDVRLLQYAILEAPPEAPTDVIDVKFGEHITLEGYAITGTPTSGNVLGVTLFWQTDAPLPTRYKVSVQLLYPSGALAQPHDSEPANYRQPTTIWEPNTTIIDNHGLPIPMNAPAGEYSIIIVMYELDNPDNRLLTINNEDKLTLEEVTIND